MKISRPNMVISIGAGVIASVLLAGVLHEGAAFIGLSVTAVLWAIYAKKENKSD